MAGDDRFVHDPYFSGQAQGSLLLAPLTVQGASTAMVLLENRRRRAAFGAARLEAISLIAGQLAVSLANVQLYENLEQRVQARTEELRKTQAQLVTAARRAGMAEIAVNVLHNVGNVLNNVNISAMLLQTTVLQSRSQGLGRVVGLLTEPQTTLGEFMGRDAKGVQLVRYMAELTRAVEEDRQKQLSELGNLIGSVNQIKAVVRGQQAYAGVSSIVEPVDVDELLEEALQVATTPWGRVAMKVVKRIESVPALDLDRQRLLQIVVNLIANASEAMDGQAEKDRELTLGAGITTMAGVERLRICVRDNGMGIAAEHLDRIFSHGFTTKKLGHGFGLHSSALAAMEIGGKLHVHSEGEGRGAEFILELPFKTVQLKRFA